MTRGTIAAMPSDITLRNPREDGLREFWQPLADAFGSPIEDDEIERERPLLELDRFVGALDRDRWIATGGAVGFRLTVPGGEVGASGITGVGVRPDYRRRGVLRQMMDWIFDDARRHDEPVAVLIATESTIYRRFGFGQASSQTSFRVATTSMAFRNEVDLGPTARFRMVDVDEATVTFARIYDRVRPGLPGALDRTEPKWRGFIVGDAEWMQRGQGPKFLVLVEVDGEPRGYAIYRIEQGWGPTGPASTLHVLEVTGVDPAAEQALWKWLFGMDLVRTVSATRGPVPHPLQQWLVEPRRLGLTVGDGLYLRILDLPAALAARGYVGSGSLVLEVSDDLVEANAGPWQLSVDGGRGSVAPTPAAPDLELDIGTLAQTYLGGSRFVDLAVAGRVRECQPGALLRADALFTPPRAPYNSTPF
jgi:predicted acetyltransferase